MIVNTVGVVAAVTSTALYLLDMRAGRVQPNRVSWFLWGVPPLIAAGIAWGEGARDSAALVALFGVCPLIIVGASFFMRQARWALGSFDYACGALSVMALAVWIGLDHPFYATLMSIGADSCASLPTLRKSWRSPFSESWMPYLLGGIGSACAVLEVRDPLSVEMMFPAWLLGWSLGLALVIGFRQRIFARRGVYSQPKKDVCSS